MAAILVVVGVIALIVFLTSGKGEKEPTRATPLQPADVPSEVQPTPSEPAEPAEPEPAPFPVLPSSLKAEATALAERARQLGKDGEKYYNEAGAAKAKGKDDLWQEKLEEAAAYYLEINESWNMLIEQIMESIPEDCPYDAEEVANHHFPNASETVRKASKRLGAINKDRR